MLWLKPWISLVKFSFFSSRPETLFATASPFLSASRICLRSSATSLMCRFCSASFPNAFLWLTACGKKQKKKIRSYKLPWDIKAFFNRNWRSTRWQETCMHFISRESISHNPYQSKLYSVTNLYFDKDCFSI